MKLQAKNIWNPVQVYQVQRKVWQFVYLRYHKSCGSRGAQKVKGADSTWALCP